MAYVMVPADRLDPGTLQALLEEFASRDGTDYGEVELTLGQKTGNLRLQLDRRELCILYHVESGQWDLVGAERARELLRDDGG